jgi:transposase
MQVTTIGIDLAKHVFQVHGVDAAGGVIVRRKLRRSEVIGFFAKLPSTVIGLEACATSHHWARSLLALGHQVRLIPPAYVKPFVKRQKNDAADAEAICEAVSRPSMRFVPVKSAEQQGVLVLHRTRDLLIRQRTMLANAFRAHLAEFGIVERLGGAGLESLIAQVEADANNEAPKVARDALRLVAEQIRDTQSRIAEIDKRIVAWHRSNSAFATVLGGIVVNAAVHIVDPGLNQAALWERFVLEEWQTIAAYCAPFPEMRDWFGWIIDTLYRERGALN